MLDCEPSRPSVPSFRGRRRTEGLAIWINLFDQSYHEAATNNYTVSGNRCAKRVVISLALLVEAANGYTPRVGRGSP